MDSAAAAVGAESARGPASSFFDRYFIAACAIFAFLFVRTWTNFAIGHEVLYLLGSRKLADPSLLAIDFTWTALPPTSFLYDHMLLPLWSFLGEFAIVVLGRFVWWASFAAALVYLCRALRLPAWTIVAGFVTWMLWGQSLALCGSPFEGFQVKSLAYSLLLAAVAFALRGRFVLAGVSAGLATAMHVIVGGWAMLALGLALLATRVPWRRMFAYGAAAAPVVLPLLIAVALFHEGAASRAEQAQMDEIYVKLAAPKCCDPVAFLTPVRSLRAAALFVLAPMLVFAWPRRSGAALLAAFLAALVLFFVLGLVADQFHWYAFLKLFPFQLANSLPALFFFVFLFGWFGLGIPARVWHKALLGAALAVAVLLSFDRNALPKLLRMPGDFIEELTLPDAKGPDAPDIPMYTWVRKNTPKDSVFVTPFIPNFWARAERAQVASIRHPPFDRRLIEWKERLVALHGSQPFSEGGYDIIPGLDYAVGSLRAEELARIRQRYGATHYVTNVERRDLGLMPLYTDETWYVYDIRTLEATSP